jgi:hypothetical protein
VSSVMVADYLFQIVLVTTMYLNTLLTVVRLLELMIMILVENMNYHQVMTINPLSTKKIETYWKSNLMMNDTPQHSFSKKEQ